MFLTQQIDWKDVLLPHDVDTASVTESGARFDTIKAIERVLEGHELTAELNPSKTSIEKILRCYPDGTVVWEFGLPVTRIPQDVRETLDRVVPRQSRYVGVNGTTAIGGRSTSAIMAKFKAEGLKPSVIVDFLEHKVLVPGVGKKGQIGELSVSEPE